MYDEESAREKALTGKGQLYLTIGTFFVGGLAISLNEVFASAHTVAQLSFVGAFLLFSIALVLVIRALGVYDYEGVCDPEETLLSYPSPPPDDEFFLDRVVDIAVASNLNSEVNDRRAGLLHKASWLLVAGVVVAFMSLTIASLL